jgi:hypothetical protein
LDHPIARIDLAGRIVGDGMHNQWINYSMKNKAEGITHAPLMPSSNNIYK